VKAASYLKVVATTSINIAGYAATSGRFLWLEGRVRNGIFRNWIRGYRYAPSEVVRPTTEQEIVEAVCAARSLRVFGSGHSFNDGVVSDDVLVSLDDYRGVVSRDLDRRQITVRSGTRIRDVVHLLAEDGLAFAALPSHDAQSIGGILSTDVHGTGRDWGFVSESVVRLKLVDALGQVHSCEPADALFRAAVGGVGAVGIIIEVTLQGVPRFNVEQRVELADVSFVRAHLDRLLAANEHLSLYFYPFSDTCQINTWNRTERPPTRYGDLREFIHISADAWLAAAVGNALAYGRLLPLSRYWSRLSFLIQRGSDLVLESNKAFNRSIYHQHQELEFTVPFEDVFATTDRFLQLYEDLYHHGLPYTLVEVRFTPGGHDRTMLGAGRLRRSAWIDLIINDSDGFELYYAAAVELVKEIGAKPHLGKFCDGITAADLEKVHGDSFDAFLDLVATHDPDGKFANAFTRRLFGPSRAHLNRAAA
jgi:FAD/FMN-containing dehydrogenase